MGDPPQASSPQRASSADRLAQSGALAEGLPAGFAAAVIDPADPALAGVFMAGSRGTRLHTGALPVPMRREIAWWMAACQASGERQIHASEWMTAWGRVFHADHGQMASAASRARAEVALRPLVRRLAIRYSDAVDMIMFVAVQVPLADLRYFVS
ncbi:MAG: hypothetical protein ACM3ML_27360 [Micromonosporaceae bacterium]